MEISKDLFLSILATDAYNRGFNAGISDGKGSANPDGSDADGLGRIGSRVGTATVIADNNSDDAQASSFYALAYDVGEGVTGITAGSVVISYRGTDNRNIFDRLTGEKSVVNEYLCQEEPGGGPNPAPVCYSAATFAEAGSTLTAENLNSGILP